VLLDANLSILFTELPLLERPRAAKRAGFDAVEFWWPFDTATPPPAEVDAFVAALDAAGTRLVGLNFFAGDMPAGDAGEADRSAFDRQHDQERRQDAAGLSPAVEAAAEQGVQTGQGERD